MRGRKMVPSLLRDLHGNPSKTKRPVDEPKPAGELHEPPDNLTPAQKEHWQYAIASAPPGLLRRLDREILVTFVIAVDIQQQANAVIAKDGLLIRNSADPRAALVRHPALAALTRAAATIAKCASEMGFTPVSRPRVSVNAGTAAPPLSGPTSQQDRPRVPLSVYLANAPQRRFTN
jgi:P27 family predicted phage terminase small subunit